MYVILAPLSSHRLASDTPSCCSSVLNYFLLSCLPTVWPGGLLVQFEPVVTICALLEFIRFLYTGRSGDDIEPLIALEVLFLTKGDEGSGGKTNANTNTETMPRTKTKTSCLTVNAVTAVLRHDLIIEGPVRLGQINLIFVTAAASNWRQHLERVDGSLGTTR